MSAATFDTYDMSDFHAPEVPRATIEVDNDAPHVAGYQFGPAASIRINVPGGLVRLNGTPDHLRALLIDMARALGRAEAQRSHHLATHCDHRGCYDEHGHTDGCELEDVHA